MLPVSYIIRVGPSLSLKSFSHFPNGYNIGHCIEHRLSENAVRKKSLWEGGTMPQWLLVLEHCI